jgi:hypothetical protein
MRRRVFGVSASVPVTPEAAIDFLLDLTRHRGLHPFLVTASVVGSGTSPDGPWWDWQVEERPPLGPLRYPLRFSARLTRTSSQSMTALVEPGLGVRLRSTTVAHPTTTGCELLETTEVSAPWPVLGYTARHGEAAHRRTFSRLPEALA